MQGLIRQMNLRENVSMAVLERIASANVINPRKERRLVGGAIRQFGIRASGSEQVVNKLSGGNQQKAVLAKWLATDPRLLIMDEPTRAGLMLERKQRFIVSWGNSLSAGWRF